MPRRGRGANAVVVNGAEYHAIHSRGSVIAYSIACRRQHSDPGSPLPCSRWLSITPTCTAEQVLARLRAWDLHGGDADGKPAPRTAHKAMGGYLLRDYEGWQEPS